MNRYTRHQVVCAALLCAVLPSCLSDDAGDDAASDDAAGDDAASDDVIAGEPARMSAVESAATAFAPACIARPVHHIPPEGWVNLKNNCGKTMHVKVVISFGSDTSCMTLTAGQSKTMIWWAPADYDYTITC